MRIDPGGRGLMFDGRCLSHHTFKTKADPVKAAQEAIYIERLRREEENERARADREAKKKRRKK
jgi:hypothetical protein